HVSAQMRRPDAPWPFLGTGQGEAIIVIHDWSGQRNIRVIVNRLVGCIGLVLPRLGSHDAGHDHPVTRVADAWKDNGASLNRLRAGKGIEVVRPEPDHPGIRRYVTNQPFGSAGNYPKVPIRVVIVTWIARVIKNIA